MLVIDPSDMRVARPEASVSSFNFKSLVIVNSLGGPHNSSEMGFRLEFNMSRLLEKVNKSFSKKDFPKQSNLRKKKRDY